MLRRCQSAADDQSNLKGSPASGWAQNVSAFRYHPAPPRVPDSAGASRVRRRRPARHRKRSSGSPSPYGNARSVDMQPVDGRSKRPLPRPDVTMALTYLTPDVVSEAIILWIGRGPSVWSRCHEAAQVEPVRDLSGDHSYETERTLTQAGLADLAATDAR